MSQYEMVFPYTFSTPWWERRSLDAWPNYEFSASARDTMI
jgi:hypothetical protein